MTNWGAHHLDIAQWGLGMDDSGPVEVTGEAKYDEQKRFEVPVWSLINYTYANGVKIILEQGAKMGTTFIGDQGAIHVNRGVLKLGPGAPVQIGAPPQAGGTPAAAGAPPATDAKAPGVKTAAADRAKK